MSKRVDILSKQQIFKKSIFAIDEVRFRHEKYDGSLSDELTRLTLERGDGVAAVVYDIDTENVIFTEQFRHATYEHGDGWLLEAPAGMFDGTEEAPDEAMRREILEEVGYEVEELRHITTFYLSPGGTSERIFLYYAAVSSTHKIGVGGGLIGEGEDIRAVEIPFRTAIKMLYAGEIKDAKTIIGLQWMQMHYPELHAHRD